MYVDLLYRPFAVSTHSRLKAAGADIAAWLESIRVSTHSRLKAAGSKTFSKKSLATVSTHSRLKAAGPSNMGATDRRRVSTHSRLKAAGFYVWNLKVSWQVSTHSRLKAAGYTVFPSLRVAVSFNTQPPEGGWQRVALAFLFAIVSTHSRLKAAGQMEDKDNWLKRVSTHSRLKAAGRAGGQNRSSIQSFNTQPPEGGWQSGFGVWAVRSPFQHTAA